MAAGGAAALAGWPLLHGSGHSSRRAAGPTAVHRPCDRRGDRRNRDRGQRRDALPGRDLGRHRQRPRQASPHHLRRRFYRQQRQPAGQHHRRRKFARGSRLGGALRRTAQFDGCGCPGAHCLSQRAACVDYRSARGKRSTLRCDHRAFSPRGGTGEASGRRSAAGRAVHREAYREELERLRQYVSMGEGI